MGVVSAATLVLYLEILLRRAQTLPAPIPSAILGCHKAMYVASTISYLAWPLRARHHDTHAQADLTRGRH